MHLTKPQKLIYDMERFSGGAIAIICGSMLISGEKNLSALKAAVNELYRRNDALRIRITENGGEVTQAVADYSEQEINVLCFENKAELDCYAQSYAQIPFDLQGALCQINIVTLPGQYGLLVKLHHLIGDAWTLALLGTQFNKLLKGEDVVSYSYADYVESENSYLQSRRYGKDRDFFLSQFKRCDEVTYLSEKQNKTLLACRKTFVIDSKKTSLINTYVQRKGTSAFMLFTAALSAYINRTKMNTEKFYIGTAVLNRSGVKENNTAGMFVNTAPMLIELDNAKTFAENLSAIEETAFSVFRHQKYNYGDVLSAIRNEFNFTEKLYDVMISYQNATVTGANIETTWYHSGSQSESLQIHIDDRDNEGIFRIHYDYLTDKFTEHEIDRLHQHICNLLFDAITDDAKKLYELNILSDDEKQKLLYDFNDTAVDYPRDKCVHQLFEEQVERTPDKVAVVACDRTLTYAELNEQANRIAHSLVARGIGIGDIVALKLTRKSYLFSAMLGTLKSGAAYMPIDPSYPEDRISYMLAESKSRYCIDEDNVSEFLSGRHTQNLYTTISHDDAFCALHTSGSTGMPKMSLLKHDSMMNFIAANQKFWKNIDTVVSATIVTFDAFIMDSVLSVAQGKQVILASEDEIYNQAKFESLFEHSEHNMLFSTPTKIENYIVNRQNKSCFARVKSFVVGGEVFSEHLLDLIKDVSPSGQIYNIYGPTEATICVLVNELTRGKLITIGKPIANTQIYIVDKYMQPTPIGVTGELCIAGDGVGAGYLNRPELTAEKFVDNPFGEGKLYKTGDLAYWREDGNVVYVGRNDFQVKIRGLRIELGEIENAICGIDGISQAVVVVRKNSEGRQLICAFYTGEEIEAKEIRAHIGKKLPKYMLPHIFAHLNEMPLTSSGKVNRKALPEVDLYAIDAAVEYVAPTTEKEEILVSFIEATLGIDKVGIMDNFFDIGGDSLKAIELISKLEKQGYHTDTKTIFECDTVKELAEQLTAAECFDEVFDYSGDIPATDAQMRVYTAQNMNSDSATYNVPYVFKVDSVDIDRLQNAVDGLIVRHESLRTHFENKDGHIIQVINDAVQCPVEQLATDDIAAFIRPFDLGQAPLLRVGYYKNMVMIDMHHIITDGSSMPIFLRELNELYMGRSLKNTPVQYKHFSVQRQDYSESEKYWLSIYNDEVPVLEINTDNHRGPKQSHNGSAIYDSVDINLHNQILAFCKEQKLTPYVFYMGAFNILLSKFSGSEDIVVGMPISGRSSKNLDTIGMFVNTIALRNRPVGTKTVAEFLQEIKENSVAAINHQDYPYGELVKKLDIQTSDRNPLFDVMFAYQSEEMTDVVFGDQRAELLSLPIKTSKYDFTFNIIPRESDSLIMAEYCTDLYMQTTMQRFIDSYKRILEQLLDSKKALMEITALTEQERFKLLYGFNDTAIVYPRDKCVHQLFEEQVERTPDKVAVIACDKTLTYAELNEQANRIAHSLVTKGIGIGDIVALKLTRKSYLFSAMLGTLKSGAAYLPVDPDYPQNRIDYMLADSNAKLFITEDNIQELLAADDVSNPHVDMSSNDLCYCIYTSGSTGKPKGTVLKHQCVVNYVNNNNNNVVHKIIKSDYKRVISVTTIGFDIFVTESLLPLANGLEILLTNEEQSKLQIKLNDLLLNCPADVLQTTPTKMKSLIVDKENLDYLKTLKAIILGGEAVDEALVSELYSYTDAKIFNIYGPTETTVWSTNTEVIDVKDITIGKPIANTQIYIVDKHMHPTPIGVTGELCIAGDGVGAGYLNRPELTAEKFVDNPFGEGKLYKTGDLAYWREDGNIVYVGRNDFQVKIRGLRIELGEIENAICGIDGISQAVVVVRKNSEGRQLICAFYTGEEIEAKEIRAHIGKKLPKYMLPHIFAHLNEMPLTSSGKVNRKALPEGQVIETPHKNQ